MVHRQVSTDVMRAARWGAPGLSQALSSIGNVALLLAAARTLSVADFGVFSLVYPGVLLVSLLVRVAIGESNMVRSADSAVRLDVAATVLGAALVVTPALGVVAFTITAIISGSWSLSIAVGLAATVVPYADTMRYSLLAGARVREAIRFDFMWTCSGVIGLLVLWFGDAFSPQGLLRVWFISAGLAVLGAKSVRPAGPGPSLVSFRDNSHWWRLTVNEMLIVGSSYITLVALGFAGGTGEVGAVRAALLPYLWVQLLITGLWLAVLSRRPTDAQLRRLTRLVGFVILLAIAVVLAVSRVAPDDWGLWLLPEHWSSIAGLAYYAAFGYAALTVAELRMLVLKAKGSTSRVLIARIVGAAVMGIMTVALLARPSPELALCASGAGHVAVAVVARGRLARDSITAADTR